MKEQIINIIQEYTLPNDSGCSSLKESDISAIADDIKALALSKFKPIEFVIKPIDDTDFNNFIHFITNDTGTLAVFKNVGFEVYEIKKLM